MKWRTKWVKRTTNQLFTIYVVWASTSLYATNLHIHTARIKKRTAKTFPFFHPHLCFKNTHTHKQMTCSLNSDTNQLKFSSWIIREPSGSSISHLASRQIVCRMCGLLSDGVRYILARQMMIMIHVGVTPEGFHKTIHFRCVWVCVRERERGKSAIRIVIKSKTIHSTAMSKSMPRRQYKRTMC